MMDIFVGKKVRLLKVFEPDVARFDSAYHPVEYGVFLEGNSAGVVYRHLSDENAESPLFLPWHMIEGIDIAHPGDLDEDEWDNTPDAERSVHHTSP